MSMKLMERERTQVGTLQVPQVGTLRAPSSSAATVWALTALTAASAMVGVPAVGYSMGSTVSHSMVNVRKVNSLATLWVDEPDTPIQSVAQVRADRDEIAWVKQHSGLTWDQLGRVFGVSRRAVHLWASGGRMNESNAEVLRAFAAAVLRHEGKSPDDTRAALLASNRGSGSVVDTFRNRQVPQAEHTLGSPFSVEEKIGVIRAEEAPGV